MTRVDNYTQSYFNSAARTRTESSKAGKTAKEEKTKKAETPKLSRGAQKVLDELKKKYGNMDFMVADFEDDDEAQEILSRGNKEFSVLFTPDELEKMAEDEDYKEKNMGRIEEAADVTAKLKEKFNEEQGEEGVEIKQIGVSFNSDGTMSYFAELEKSSEKQRERIEQTREKNAEAKKAEEKKDKAKNDGYHKTKSVTVTADSEESLLEKMRGIDWSKVKEEEQDVSGRKFDYSI